VRKYAPHKIGMTIRRISVITEHTLVINDSVYINPEDLDDWNSLTEQERENLAGESPW
jgi:hypothetical protein